MDSCERPEGWRRGCVSRVALVSSLELSGYESGSIPWIKLIALVDVNPSHRYGWLACPFKGSATRDFHPHAFAVKELKLLRARLLDEVVLERLASQVILLLT